MHPRNATMLDLTITIRDTEENGQGEKDKKCGDHLELREMKPKYFNGLHVFGPIRG